MPETNTGDHPDLKMVNPGAAAIDIGSTMHMAAVNPQACGDMPVRAFGTFTQDLHALADWFADCVRYRCPACHAASPRSPASISRATLSPSMRVPL